MAPDPLRSLLDAAVEGDHAAAAELVRRTQPDVWRVCCALGSQGEEEDLVQETYLRALGSIRTYRGDAPVRAWLMSIARNVCADHVRHRVRRRRLVEKISAVPTEHHFEPPIGLAELLDDLDDDRREAFILTQMVGLSYEDAAITLNCPIGTIRSRVARGRAELMAATRRAEAR